VIQPDVRCSFFVFSLVAALCGFTGISAATADIAPISKACWCMSRRHLATRAPTPGTEAI
jgi:hypothetical protein